jgi:hypothetical protein
VLEDKDNRTIARLKTIAIGPVVGGDEVSVESGLDAGSKVIVEGSNIVYDGEPVSVVP